MIQEDDAEAIINAGIEKVNIRTVLNCKTHHGVCSKCYGRNLATGKEVNIGEAVGIIAAQSIGYNAYIPYRWGCRRRYNSRSS